MSEFSQVPPQQPPPPQPPPIPPVMPSVIYVQSPPVEPKRRRSIGRVVLIIAVVFLCFVVVGAAISSFAKAWVTMAEGGDEIREKYVTGSSSDEKKVAVITISGMIAEGDEGVLGSAGMMGKVVAELKRAQKDDKVVGVVLEVNSPGGTVTASDQILHEVQKTKKAGKRVVVWMGSLAASGGYYVSCQADRIYASPTTITGSIGVIMDLFNVQKLSDMVGVKMVIVKSGKFKDMGSPFRDMTDEERAKFQAFIDGAFGRFKDVIKAGRCGSGGPMKPEEVDAIADGSILTADEALKAGLVDKVDYIEAALDDAKGTHAKAAVVRYYRPMGLFGAFMDAKAPSKEISVRLETPVPQLNPGLYYLWMPGMPAK